MSYSLFSMRRISKRFGATVALDEADFALRPGEVHAVIGENGAGKSTLMKILAGVYRPDSGVMAIAEPDPHPSIADRPQMLPFNPLSPAEARELGVAMIYQERNLAPDLSVEANVMLGLEGEKPWRLLNQRALRESVVEALSALGHTDIDPSAMVSGLGPGKRQIVELARALVVDARIVVLDEPTSSLAAPDVKRLFKTIARLQDRGVGVVFISHFLEEILEVADYYTALRDGRVVDSGRAPEANLSALIRVMTGRTVGDLFPRVPHEIGDPVLELTGVSGRKLPHDANLSIHKGEILGLFGLVGSGRTELMRAINGMDSVQNGSVSVGGIIDQGSSTPRRRKQGLGMLSEDRQHEGLAQSQSVMDNMTYGGLETFTTWGLLNRSAQKDVVRTWLERLDIRSNGPDQRAETLSGGNQQKVALARLLHWDADILLLDEPTRGIDVASKADIYQLIGELAAVGKSICFVSSSLPELLGVCDRICVMYRGKLSEPIPALTADPHQIMALATTGEMDVISDVSDEQDENPLLLE